MKFHSKLLAAALTATFILSACGGGGGGGDSGGTAAATTASVGGVAAIGAPIVGGTVSVKCAGGGTASATTNGTGGWTVTLPADSFPCAASVSGGTAGGVANALTLHSMALAAGTMNITTLTDLFVARLTGQTPATWFGAVSSTALGTQITSSALATAQALLTASLATLPGGPTLPAGFNPLTTIFSASAGDPIDALLDLYRTALTNAGISYNAALVNAVVGQALNSPALTGDGAALNGVDGVTGTVNQVTHTYTGNVGWLPTNGFGFFNSFNVNGNNFDALTFWKLHTFPASVGLHACGTGGEGANIQLAVGGTVYSTVGDGGSCVIEVLSVSPIAITGRFRATLINTVTRVATDTVSDGYFRLAVPNGGGQALPAGEQGMSFKVDGQTYRQTQATSLAFETYAGVVLGAIQGTYAQLHTLPNQVGTYACGTGDYYRAINVWFWWNGKFYYAGSRQSLNPAGPAGSSCSITITQTGTIGGGNYTGTLEGSFSGTFVTSDGQSSVTVTDGLFRFISN